MKKKNGILEKVQGSIIMLIVFIFIWEGLIWIFGIKNFILPHLFEVLGELVENFDYIISNALITFYEALSGCFLGIIIAVLLAIVMVHNKFCDDILRPIIVFSQTVPKIAIAPILIIWFGTGLTSKIVIVVLLSFFPVVINLNTGLRSVKKETLELFRIYGANKYQVLLKARIPYSLSFFFAGLRNAVALSFIGAIVGEFVSSTEGIGYLIIQAENNFNTPMEFAAIFVLSIVAYFIYQMVQYIEKRVVYWQV